jgi:hypothetical protein
MKDEFEDIADEAIRRAEGVPCDIEEFRKGLVTIYHKVLERVEMEDVNPRDPRYLS